MSYPIHPGRGTLIDPVRLLLDLLLAEIRANASAAEEHAFLRGVGGELAARLPFAGEGDAATLEDSANALLGAAGLGSMRLTVREDALHIRHRLPPAVDGVADDGWRSALPAILEGAYDSWFRTMGSGERLHTTMVGGDDEEIEFRHGL